MRAPRYVYRLISPLMLLLVWELASRVGLANALILPPPSKALADLIQLALDGELSKALWASLYRVVCGFALAVALGITLGALMARIRLLDLLVDPLVELLRPMSPLAIFPLAILWFGIGDASKIFVIGLAGSFPVILNTYAGVSSIDANFFRASESLGAR